MKIFCDFCSTSYDVSDYKIESLGIEVSICSECLKVLLLAKERKGKMK